MNARVFVDTNVLAYAFGPDDDPRQLAASDLLRSLRTTARLVVSAQVLGELYVVLTRKLRPPLDPEAARAAVELVSRWEVVDVDGALAVAATRRSSASRISYWDALIVEAALRAGCDTLVTEDLHDGWDVEGLRVSSPFAG